MATPHSFEIGSQARFIGGYRGRLGFQLDRPGKATLRGELKCEHKHSDRREAEQCSQDFIYALIN